MPSVYVATQVVQPLNIINTRFEDVAGVLAAVIADSITEASSVNRALDVAVAVSVHFTSVGNTLILLVNHVSRHIRETSGPRPNLHGYVIKRRSSQLRLPTRRQRRRAASSIDPKSLPSAIQGIVSRAITWVETARENVTKALPVEIFTRSDGPSSKVIAHCCPIQSYHRT